MWALWDDLVRSSHGPLVVLVLTLGGGLASYLVVAHWRGRRDRWRAHRVAVVRAERALAGEHAAHGLLRARGYAIVASQARVIWAPEIDGTPAPVELRADYLVEHDGRRYVAEVKTGELAIHMSTAATRRQLLEYRCAFDVDGVLLVCPELGTVRTIEFPMAGDETVGVSVGVSRWWIVLAVGAMVVAVAVAAR